MPLYVCYFPGFSCFFLYSSSKHPAVGASGGPEFWAAAAAPVLKSRFYSGRSSIPFKDPSWMDVRKPRETSSTNEVEFSDGKESGYALIGGKLASTNLPQMTVEEEEEEEEEGEGAWREKRRLRRMHRWEYWQGNGIRTARNKPNKD